jgi:hypothetical protein
MTLANPGIVPHLMSAHNFRVADLAVTGARLMPGQMALPEPLLVIEILSPSNRAETWSNVWAYTRGLRDSLMSPTTVMVRPRTGSGGPPITLPAARKEGVGPRPSPRMTTVGHCIGAELLRRAADGASLIRPTYSVTREACGRGAGGSRASGTSARRRRTPPR